MRRYNNSFKRKRTHAFGFSDIRSNKFIIKKGHVWIAKINKLWVLQNKKYTQVFRSIAWDVWLGKVASKSVKLKIYKIKNDGIRKKVCLKLVLIALTFTQPLTWRPALDGGGNSIPCCERVAASVRTAGKPLAYS